MIVGLVRAYRLYNKDKTNDTQHLNLLVYHSICVYNILNTRDMDLRYLDSQLLSEVLHLLLTYKNMNKIL